MSDIFVYHKIIDVLCLFSFAFNWQAFLINYVSEVINKTLTNQPTPWPNNIFAHAFAPPGKQVSIATDEYKCLQTLLFWQLRSFQFNLGTVLSDCPVSLALLKTHFTRCSPRILDTELSSAKREAVALILCVFFSLCSKPTTRSQWVVKWSWWFSTAVVTTTRPPPPPLRPVQQQQQPQLQKKDPVLLRRRPNRTPLRPK